MAVVTPRVYELAPQQRVTLREGTKDRTRSRCRGRVHIDGPLDPAVLDRAIRQVIAAHEILRTDFVSVTGLRVPVQNICAEPRLRLISRDLGHPARAEEAVAEAWRELSALGRDNDGDAVPGFALIRTTPDAHLLLLDFDSMTADPGTLALFCETLAAAYAACSRDRVPAPPAVQYADVSTWLNELRQTDHWAIGQNFWNRVWSRHRPEEIATQRLALEAGGSAGFLSHKIPLQITPLSARISSLAEARGVPTTAVMLAAWAAIIGQMADVERQVIGYGCDLRTIEGIGPVLGPCRTMVPVSVALGPEATFAELIADVAAGIEAAQAWQQVFDWPAAEIEASGANGGPPAFLPFAYECRAQPGEAVASGIRFRLNNIDDSGVRHAVRLLVETGEHGLSAQLEFDDVRFDLTTAMHIGAQLERLLIAATAVPDRRLARLLAYDEAEARRSGTIAATEALLPLSYKTIHAGFRRQALRTPDRVAVQYAATSVTFAELDRQSSRIAQRLVRWGVGPDVPVALCLPRSVEAVAAILGVLKAGGCFVPLSPADPPERISNLIHAVSARILITMEAVRTRLPNFDGHTLCIGRDADSLAVEPDSDPPDQAGDRQAAYIIHTSGSTGQPKAIVVEHRSTLALLQALEEMLAGTLPNRPLRVSLNAPLTFDASIQQLLFLLRGDCLVIIPDDTRLAPPALNAFLARQSIDVFDCTPSHLRRLVESGLTEPGGPRPAVVLVAGEAIDPVLWSRLAAVSETAFFNIYGPTEATVDATAVRIKPHLTPTIGRPLSGYRIYVLDRKLDPVPVGVPGEIHIGGAGVARCYHGQPGLTGDRFLPDPYSERPGGRMYATGDRALILASGELLFLGRDDGAFKLRGVRIDPAEIETALRRHPGIRQAAVVLADGLRGEPVVAAHLCPTEGPAPDRAALRIFLRASLPEAMLPTVYVLHDDLPLLPSGKVDRVALQTFAAPPSLIPKVPPRTPLEAEIAEIWRTVLDVPEVGRDENFFEIGGHSLMLFKVQHLLAEKLGRPVPLTDLVTFDTVTALAARLETTEPTESSVEDGAARAKARRVMRPLKHAATTGES